MKAHRLAQKSTCTQKTFKFSFKEINSNFNLIYIIFYHREKKIIKKWGRENNEATASRRRSKFGRRRWVCVEMQQCQEPWELKLQTKAKHFDFRFKAAIQHLPLASKFSRFSIRLKLYGVFIKFKGNKAHPPNRTKFTSFSSKFRRILQKFRIRHNTRTAIPATSNNEVL